MTQGEGKVISVENIDTRELYGAKNVYLEQIKALHPKLKIIHVRIVQKVRLGKAIVRTKMAEEKAKEAAKKS